MTCCSNDIARVGWVCQGLQKPSARTFIRLTAQCEKVTNQAGDQSVIMLHELNVEKAAAPAEKYITFGSV